MSPATLLNKVLRSGQLNISAVSTHSIHPIRLRLSYSIGVRLRVKCLQNFVYVYTDGYKQTAQLNVFIYAMQIIQKFFFLVNSSKCNVCNKNKNFNRWTDACIWFIFFIHVLGELLVGNISFVYTGSATSSSRASGYRYADKKKRTIEAWERLRPKLLSTRVEELSPACFDCCLCDSHTEAIIYCQDCGPNAYYCSNCCDRIHTNILFHRPQQWMVRY